MSDEGIIIRRHMHSCQMWNAPTTLLPQPVAIGDRSWSCDREACQFQSFRHSVFEQFYSSRTPDEASCAAGHHHDCLRNRASAHEPAVQRAESLLTATSVQPSELL